MIKYVLYGTKNETKYFVTNVNPVLWSPDIECAKVFNDINSAKFSILRDWDNYEYMLGQINAGLLNKFFVSIVVDGVERERVKLLWNNFTQMNY